MNQPLDRQHDERRSAVRARMLCLVDVVSTQTDEPIGFVIDLSTGGFCLLSKTGYLPGTRHDVRLRVHLDADASQSAHVVAECRWSRPSHDKKTHKSGFAFIDLDSESDALVRDALRLVSDLGPNEV